MGAWANQTKFLAIIQNLDPLASQKDLESGATGWAKNY
jgi:hypothetical protein